ncbi:MAG: uroporphyrinogen decarboxylase family protein [Candidatus Geothermarchaeales archaeon]
MNPRDRVLAAIEREEPDKVPLDFGGRVSSIHEVAYEELKRHLGVRDETVLIDARGRIALPAESILKRFEIDTRYVYSGKPKPLKTLPDGSYIDAWGIKRVPAGYYYDVPSDGHPLRNATEVDELDEYEWPAPLEAFNINLKELEGRARSLYEKTSFAVVYPYTRMTGFFMQSWFMRGIENFFIDLKRNPDFACRLMDKVLEISLKATEEVVEAVGNYVDVFCVGDDLAMQDGPLISLDTFRRLIKPRHKRLLDTIKRRTDAKIFFHTDGSSSYYFDDLVEIGVDIVNPVQVSAAHMDTRVLKERYGQKLCFWGAIDTQRVLPYGTPQDVEEEVKRRIRDLAPGGGYVLCAVHNIQPRVPPQNVCAMYEAAMKYRSYRT